MVALEKERGIALQLPVVVPSRLRREVRMKKTTHTGHSFGAKVMRLERVLLVLLLALKIATIVVQLVIILRA